ncbi:MAG: hypothetical protein ABGX16_16865 [Pirellulales bacterium]
METIIMRVDQSIAWATGDRPSGGLISLEPQQNTDMGPQDGCQLSIAM